MAGRKPRRERSAKSAHAAAIANSDPRGISDPRDPHDPRSPRNTGHPRKPRSPCAHSRKDIPPPPLAGGRGSLSAPHHFLHLAGPPISPKQPRIGRKEEPRRQDPDLPPPGRHSSLAERRQHDPLFPEFRKKFTRSISRWRRLFRRNKRRRPSLHSTLRSAYNNGAGYAL